REDNEIELALFVPINYKDRDPESQAIFKRNQYYSVGGKIVPGSHDGIPKMTVSTSTHVTISDRAPNSNKCPLSISLVGVPQKMPIEIKDTESSVIETLISDYVGKLYNYPVKITFPHNNSRFKYLKPTIRPQESIIFASSSTNPIRSKLLYVHNTTKDLNDTSKTPPPIPDNPEKDNPRSLKRKRKRRTN
ncbi:1277_t:CDS:2, partial [Racocetra persica]